MKALVLSLVTTLGVGGVYLTQEPIVLPPVIQQEVISPLENARRATFLIALPTYRISGSATLVGRKKLDDNNYRYTALTAYHVIEDMAKKIAEDKTTADHTIEMMFQPSFHGKPLRITLTIDDIGWMVPSYDWAAIMFEMEHKISCVELATREEFNAIKSFERIYAVGCGGAYGQHCRYGIIGATHNEHKDIEGQTVSPQPWNLRPESFFRPYINVWYGDSGGAVYNKEGKLIGIINAFGIVHRGFDQMPVPHSAIALKAYVVLDIIKDSKDFFLVQD